jgi:hypothetical protein
VETKCWYINSGDDPARFAKWLTDEEEGFSITSSQAYVAVATVACAKCNSNIEVICIHCESGTASEEPLTQFTVSDIAAMNDALARHLEPWPTFKRIDSSNLQAGNFANHCSFCGALQEDLYLHSEPDDVFFSIPRAPPGSIKLTPIPGQIQLSGDEHFEIG